jgi:oxygen-independent coproporphyrinogen-3 oxidase
MAAARESLSRYGLSVQSIYIGGGTPTSLKLADLDALLARTVTLFAGEATEFTVEAGRPDSLDDAKIELLAGYGVTRVSVNPQTMQQKTLKLIGRMHSVQDIICVFGKIRMVKIPVVNMDVIAGLPGENAEDMADTLRQIAALKPVNLTVHTLALKRGSRLSESVEAYEAPDAATTAEMLALADQTARNLGMQPYFLYRQKKMAGNLENVGYSLPGKECIYNIQVIDERQTILGIGPAATTKVVEPCGLTNYYQPKDISTYINSLPDRLQKRNALLAAALAK